MNYVEAICPHCGAKLTVDNSLMKAYCQYCGAEFQVEQAVKNYKNIQIKDSFNTTNSYNTVINNYGVNNDTESMPEKKHSVIGSILKYIIIGLVSLALGESIASYLFMSHNLDIFAIGPVGLVISIMVFIILSRIFRKH